MIIWIIKGRVQHRGFTTLEFIGAAQTEREAFEILYSKKDRYSTFVFMQYDVVNRRSVGKSKTIWSHQIYNHTQDGHLDPPERRDEEGLCKSRGGWGPYCKECDAQVKAELDKAFKGITPEMMVEMIEDHKLEIQEKMLDVSDH